MILKKFTSKDKNEISIGRDNSLHSSDSANKDNLDHKKRENIDKEDK